MNDQLKKEILEVMERARWCVMATVDGNSNPEAAIVGFSHNDELELIVGTSSQTRKFANLKANPRIAIAIGDNEAEVQYEGEVTQLDVSVDAAWMEEHLRQVPAAKFYFEDPDQTWFKVKPHWIRLSVHSAEHRIEEVSFA
jgi:general stress protein 26